VGDEDYDSD
jgi:hypothetical protein